eukprot:CAMPEP_0194355086 /NCGR_PEP_ID=MMETSP0174-20130528/3064_1 /TAXON_ID=216777 /ORGANISM="Proboscia alata, Strain PI-D3" /LENGTH=127 /DNA_ID=CAMNT_0039124237 /DNA_START=97 /DNA_END=480 /DNA_ORIENTATION=+
MGGVTNLSDLSANDKQELVASLSAIVVGGSGELSSENLVKVAEASGNTLTASWATLFSSVVTSGGGIAKFCPAPGGGGGSGGGGGGGDAAAAEEAVVEKPVEEEEVDAMDGGINMFGDDEAAGSGDY